MWRRLLTVCSLGLQLQYLASAVLDFVLFLLFKLFGYESLPVVLHQYKEYVGIVLLGSVGYSLLAYALLRYGPRLITRIREQRARQ